MQKDYKIGLIGPKVKDYLDVQCNCLLIFSLAVAYYY